MAFVDIAWKLSASSAYNGVPEEPEVVVGVVVDDVAEGMLIESAPWHG